MSQQQGPGAAPAEAPPAGAAPVKARGPELAVALLLAAIGAAVIADSLRVGIGWADDGPRSGYFPFGIGLVLLATSLWTAAQALRHWRGGGGDFAERAQLKSVFSVLVPMGVYVAAIVFLGIYLPSAALIAWFMARHGRHHWGTTAAVAIGVPLVFFLVFERWFLVPLPKGPVEALFGL
jgi:hypothetical protein